MEKCHFFEKGKCREGSNCRFFHPEIECRYFKYDKPCPKGERCLELHKARVNQFKDCDFWLQGYCKYEESVCRQGKHDQRKLGTKRRRTRSNEGGSPPKRHNSGSGMMDEMYKRQENFLAEAAGALEQMRKASTTRDQFSSHNHGNQGHGNLDLVNHLRDLLGFSDLYRQQTTPPRLNRSLTPPRQFGRR